MPTPSNLLGARLGAYEIQAVIGSGGMATVYRAFDHNLHRQVALKVLSDMAAAQPGFAERFRQEARLIARLRHPHIVQVYDFGQVDDVVYMVQELLPGPTLDERLANLAARGQRMPRREIVTALKQLAAALDAAHAAGVIHRDVKPGNALYNAEGALVLTDFGIAKTVAGDGTQTQTGVVLGTPVYVSPEQARGEPLTLASDIYALGVVLYELIGGRPPFDGTTPLGIVLKHLQETPPPLQPLRASLPPAAEAVVQRALAKQPDLRYSTASELGRALEQAWPEPRQPPAPAADIHAVPTTVWQPPQLAGGASADPAQMNAARPAAPASTAAASRRPVVGPGRRIGMLPVLAATLAVVLLGGIVLALRSASTTETSGATAVATSVAPQEAVSPPPTEAAGEGDAGPLSQVRTLLGESADAELRANLDGAERALAEGDAAGATQTLGALQRQILQARRDGRISAETMRASLGVIQTVADEKGLTLPFQVEP